MSKVIEILKEEEKPNITPLIDVVFLLLIYFMLTTTLIKQEADLGVKLPAPVQSTEVEPPEEYFVVVKKNDLIFLDNEPIAAADDSQLEELFNRLARLKQTAELIPGGKIMVTIAPEEEARHGRIIDVLNVCSRAKIKHVSFTSAEES